MRPNDPYQVHVLYDFHGDHISFQLDSDTRIIAGCNDTRTLHFRHHISGLFQCDDGLSYFQIRGNLH